MASLPDLDFAGYVTYLTGLILLISGVAIAYFTTKTEFVKINPILFVPIGLGLAAVGVMVLLAKGD